MKTRRFIFKTPGGEIREGGFDPGERDGDETVFHWTQKGEDLFPIYQLVEERSRTTDENRRAEIIREILVLKKNFEAVHNEDPLDLIVELFGGDEEGEE